MKRRLLIVTIVLLACAFGDLIAGDFIKFFSGKHYGKSSPDSALLYFVRPAKIGKGERIWTFADQFPLGGTRGKSYTFAQVPPGKRMIWAKAQNIDVLEIDLQPGETYYIKQEIKSGGVNAWVTLSVLTKAEWERAMEECKKYAKLTVRGESRIAAIGRQYYEKARAKLREQQPTGQP